MKYLFILSGLVCLSFMLLPACAPPAEEQVEPVAEEAPSTEADVEAIKSMLTDDWSTAVKQEDVETLMSFYSDEAISMSPDEPAWVGHQAIRAGHERNVGNTTYDMVTTINDVVMSGEWACVRGTDKSTETPKAGGEPSIVTANWMVLLKRQPDGNWKILWEMWNRDAPVPAAPIS